MGLGAQLKLTGTDLRAFFILYLSLTLENWHRWRILYMVFNWIGGQRWEHPEERDQGKRLDYKQHDEWRRGSLHSELHKQHDEWRRGSLNSESHVRHDEWRRRSLHSELHKRHDEWRRRSLHSKLHKRHDEWRRGSLNSWIIHTTPCYDQESSVAKSSPWLIKCRQ